MDATISPMRRAPAALLAGLVLALVPAGCGSDPPGGAPRAAAADDAPPRAPAKQARESAARKPRVKRARCDAGVPDCVAVTGRVIYVEAVDPDGDGDAHYVLAGGGVTAPGITVIDVAKEQRPRRLPRRGELVSAAGPVQTGSHGQQQIAAVVLYHQGG